MNMEQFLAELSRLDGNAFEQLKAAIVQREHELQTEQPSQSAEEWGVVLDQFIDAFWENTPVQEQREILDAIRLKN